MAFMLRNDELVQVVGHALAATPMECCGLIGTVNDEATLVVPCRNADQSGKQFSIGPVELLDGMNAIEAAGAEFGAVYHSHPTSDALMSEDDIGFAGAWPGLVWVIVGLGLAVPEVRSWAVGLDGVAREAGLPVVVAA